MRNQTENEFKQNISRVDSLISAYQELEKQELGDPQTRKDVLRAAIVFMHSTIEEIIRNLYVWLLPNGTCESLNKIPFAGHNNTIRPKSILLGDLKDYEGRFVENVILESIEKYVDTMNLNNSTQLELSLMDVGIKTNSLKGHYSNLDKIMKRRHQIVHQMDRDNNLDPQAYPVTDITYETVQDWKSTLNNFFIDLLHLLPLETK